MSAVDPRYSQRVRTLFGRLDGAGEPSPGPGRLVAGEACALDRGAWVRFAARLAGDRIEDCRFRAFGCPHTLAAASYVAGSLRGAALADAAAIDAAALRRELDAPAEKMGRLLVVEDALRALLADARGVQ